MGPPDRASSTVGVFLGIYGDQWVDNAIASVERQDAGPLDVVVAVNGDWPRAVQRLAGWQGSTRHSVTIALNGRNLGPLGSWYANRDLVTAPWVSFLHQDDEYLPEHVPYLEAVARTAPPEVLAVFTSMEGMDPSGRTVPAPPMDNEYLNMASAEVTLPAVLRRHPLPTPALMIRYPEALVTDLAWYDSGAADSEWFARLACRGKFRIISDVTVRYRASPHSESHSTGWQSRAWQWAQSLDRFINSDDFVHALTEIPEETREAFCRGVLNAIPARYPDAPIFGFLQFAASQRMAHVWGYPGGSPTDFLARYLAAEPGSAALRNLEALTGRAGTESTGTVEATLAALLGQPPRRGKTEETGRAIFQRYGHLLPRSTQMAAYRAYDRLWSRRGAR